MRKEIIHIATNQLFSENQELKQYIYELEETLNSIRNGEIDAIVVSGADGEKLYSLSSVETKYRIILEEMYEGAITLTKEGLITYCNSRFAELFSVPIEKLIGSYFVDLLDENEEKEFLRILQTGLIGKSIGELTYKFGDGHTKDFRISISALPSEIENGFCILFSDISDLRIKEKELQHLNSVLELKVADRTADLNRAISELREEASKRKIAEEELTKSLERFNLANLATFDIIWDWDIQTKQFWWNNNLKTLFGYGDEDFIMGVESWFNRIHPDDLNRMKTSIHQVLNSDQTNWSDRYRYKRHDGTFAYTEDRGFIVRNSHNRPIRMTGAMRDISKLKEFEDKLIIAKEKAEESDRLKTAFLANMSHEIRTPLNGILGFAELLKTPDLPKTETNKYVEMITKGGDRLLGVINDILDVSKIEAGLMELDLSNTDIHLHTQYVFSFFSSEAEKKGIKFDYKNGSTSERLYFQTDREKLYAILINLLKNAIKFTDKGSIEFGYRVNSNVLISGSKVNPLVLEFYVKDTGIGIPENRQEAIFDRFTQSITDDTRAIQGNGLGLSIAKSYVEMLGGELWVESKEGEGSTFYFTISDHPMEKVKS
jgi:PAS domain S-box-containing protein